MGHVVGAMGDSDWQVRRVAVWSMGTLVGAAPQHATVALPHLLRALRDEHSDVGSAALRSLDVLVSTSSELSA